MKRRITRRSDWKLKRADCRQYISISLDQILNSLITILVYSSRVSDYLLSCSRQYKMNGAGNRCCVVQNTSKRGILRSRNRRQLSKDINHQQKSKHTYPLNFSFAQPHLSQWQNRVCAYAKKAPNLAKTSVRRSTYPNTHARIH